jgi:hypothetical protein
MEIDDPALRPVRVLVEQHLALPTSTWTTGVPGALAGFVRRPDEPAQRGPNSVVTGRGGIRVALPDDAVAVAYEAPSGRDPLRWHQAVALCVPAVPGPARTAVTELGPDTDALRPQDTGGVLFDLGLGAPTVELLARTPDPDAVAALRAVAGRGPGSAQPVLATHPVHVVARTAAGRIEVYGGGRGGPYAWLRPGRVGTADPAHVPVPPGTTSVLRLRPAHPAADENGRPRPFDPERHVAFQALLAEFGDPLLGVAQADAVAAVRAMRPPPDTGTGGWEVPAVRAAVAVGLRRLALTDGTTGALAAWRSRLGPTPELADPDEL